MQCDRPLFRRGLAFSSVQKALPCTSGSGIIGLSGFRMAKNIFSYRLCFLGTVILGTMTMLMVLLSLTQTNLQWRQIPPPAVRMKAFDPSDQPQPEMKPNLEMGKRFELYVRLTSTPTFKQQLDEWLFGSINLFFPKYLAATVVVLDKEKAADWEYGKAIVKQYPQMNLRTCYMEPIPQDVIHNWGKERMYLDMMHADSCTQREFVGLLDVDTLFVTAVTEDLLFEDSKPIVTGRIGIPRIPCWIDTAEYILGRKQVMQCMSYFPVVFKVAHIIEMRKYVEKIHNKTFMEVFKIAPQETKTETWCFCHYSIMCNYVWYHHREEYAWHLQIVPGGKWTGQGARPSMVSASYFENEVRPSEKIPIPRSSVHARHLMYKGRYLDPAIPPKSLTNSLLKEGICYSFGFEVCPEKCTEFDKSRMHNILYEFENYHWQWDKRCHEMQMKHYAVLRKFIKSHSQEFFLDINNRSTICKVLDNLKS